MLLNREVAHLDGRQPAVELDPFFATDRREVEPELGAREKQLGVHVIFGDRIHAAGLGQIAGYRDPAFSFIGALDQVRLEVAVLVIFESDVDGPSVVL